MPLVERAIEVIYHTACEFVAPNLIGQFLDCLKEIQEKQVPPYSKGVFMFDIVGAWRHRQWYNDLLWRDLAWSVFTELCRMDAFYNDQYLTRHSLVRLDGYTTFTENYAKRYPGYVLDKQGMCVPSTDHTVNLDKLFHLLRSRDIDSYIRNKDKFFGPSARYTTQDAVEQMKVLYTTFPRSGNSMMRKYYENVSG